MPAMESAYRLQTALLWELTGAVDDYGELVVTDPVEIMARWVKKEGDRLDSAGNRISYDATAIVAREISVGSRMWLGDEDEWAGTGTADGEDVMIVVAYSETPDLKNRDIRRSVALKYYKEMPDE